MTMTVGGTSGLVFPDSSTQNTAAKVGMVNRVLNGAMMIDQRNAGASVSANNNYTVDRWLTETTASGKFTVQQNAGAVTPPAGFTNYVGCTSTSAYTVGSSDYFAIEQRIEGYNVSDLGFGAAGASSVTVSFWVYSSLTGSFGANIMNGAENRIYPFLYSIPAANTWTKITQTIAGDITGTWNKNNTAGMIVTFFLGAGSTQVGAAGNWTNAPAYCPTGAVNVVSTSGATLYITGVQLEKGSTATSFDYRPYGTELTLCQRYYQVIDRLVVIPAVTNIYPSWSYITTMRTNASLTFVPDAGSGATFAVGDSGFYQNNNHSTNSGGTAKLSAEL